MAFDGAIRYNDQSEQAYNVNIKEANQARKRKRAIIRYMQSTKLHECENKYS